MTSAARLRPTARSCCALQGLFLSWVSLAAAQDDPLLPSFPHPHKVWVQTNFIQVGKLDALEQGFYADFYLTLFWHDERLQPDDEFDTATRFWPQPEFTNRLRR